MITTDLKFQKEEQWLRKKLGKFSGSRVGDLMKGSRCGKRFGKTAARYIQDVAAEILTGQQARDLSGIQAIEWGRQYEHDAVKEYKKRTGANVHEYGAWDPQFFLFNDYSGVSPDAEDLSEDVRLEVKCPFNSTNHLLALMAQQEGEGNAWLKKYNKMYYAQLQFNLMTEMRGKYCERARFVSYDPRMRNPEHRLAIIEILPDGKFQQELYDRLETATEVLAEYITALSEPYQLQEQGKTLIS